MHSRVFSAAQSEFHEEDSVSPSALNSFAIMEIVAEVVAVDIDPNS